MQRIAIHCNTRDGHFPLQISQVLLGWVNSAVLKQEGFSLDLQDFPTTLLKRINWKTKDPGSSKLSTSVHLWRDESCREVFERKLIDKICGQILSSWSVDVDGIFPNRNFWIFVGKTLFASPQFSRPETSWKIFFSLTKCLFLNFKSQNYIWNIGSWGSLKNFNLAIYESILQRLKSFAKRLKVMKLIVIKWKEKVYKDAMQ